MIFQIRKYINDNLGVDIYANQLNEDAGEKHILVLETSSILEPLTNTTIKGLQVLVRDIDSAKSRVLAIQVFDLLNNKFGLTLPSITVDGVIYSAVYIDQISANTEPITIGNNENGLAEFSLNFRILYRRL